MKLQTKLLAAIGLVFVLHFFSIEYFSHRQIKADVIHSIREQAGIIRAMLMSLRKVYQRQFLEHDIPINEKTLGLLPAHSISRISEEFRQLVETGLTFNNVSDVPRNSGNAADAIELEAMRFFRQNADEKERMVSFTSDQGEPYYHFSQPIWVKPRCLKCHGSLETAPDGIRQRYDTAYNYQVGDLRGLMSIKLPARIIEEKAAEQRLQNMTSIVLGFLITFLVLSLLLRRTVLAPVTRLREATLKLADGDYQARAPAEARDELAQVSRSFNLMADQISQREKALSTQKALYEALSETNKSICRLESPQQLFQRVCEIAVQHGGLAFAWIGRIDSQAKVVRPLASAGIHVACLQAMLFSLDEGDPQGAGPVSVAARNGHLVVVNDLQHETSTAPWHQLARQEGIASVAVFPLLSGDELTLTFSLYAAKPRFFTEEIVSLLEEMANEVLFAVGNYRLARSHAAAHEQLERLNRQMSLLLESTGEGIFGISDSGECIFVNRAAQQLLGYEKDELIGYSIHGLIHHARSDGSSLPIEHCPICNVFKSGDSIHINDEHFWRKDGSSFPVEYSAYPMREGDVLTGAVTVFRDVSETQAMARKMSFLATHDTLTGLLNRYAFEQRLAEALETVRLGDGEGYALCYMDLDQFKVVNDTCGHVAGDAMLEMISQLLQRVVRKSDILARLGGDEFALLLENCTLSQAEHLSWKVCDAVRECRFSWKEKSFSSGISIGVVPISRESESSHSVLSAADSACYVAKEMGRNRVHVQAGTDGEVARRQGEMQWVAEIQAAIAEQRLCLHYQPIVPLLPGNQGRIHFELLLRMQGRDGKNIPPGAFIPAAERYNLMPTLDRWVINSAFDWLSRHPEVLARTEFCSINLSGESLGDERLYGFIVSELGNSRLSAENICFEITETAAVRRLDQATSLIVRLRQLGCRFALDDFGSGMSSFAYLKTLPVDFLKIDGGFVKDILGDPIDRAMVHSINEIGHVMGLQTIAEYVENPEIRQALSEMGVDYGQGFGICAPAPLERLLDVDTPIVAA